MTEGAANPVLVELWRGEIRETVHRGAAAVCRPDGAVVEAWGDVARAHLPRSASKMIQALPLVESGAADAAGLGERELAMACASHGGAAEHLAVVGPWLRRLGLGEEALLCGLLPPLDAPARRELRESGGRLTTVHHQCSGKHTGFLTLAQHLGAGPDYIEPSHPVQRAVAEATEAACGEAPAGHATDGCSAPNFAVSVKALATAMARYAEPGAAFSGARAEASRRLTAAMIAHPLLIGHAAGAATRLTEAGGGRIAAKTGADGGFVAILPERGLGVAVKIDDGSDRAAAAAMAAILARLGEIDRADPLHADLATPPLMNARRIRCGSLRPSAALA